MNVFDDVNGVSGNLGGNEAATFGMPRPLWAKKNPTSLYEIANVNPPRVISDQHRTRSN